MQFMIREMRVSDWNEMMDIYKQSLERGDVTFRTECPTYEERDREHIKECRFLYRLVKRNDLYYSNIAAAMEMS